MRRKQTLNPVITILVRSAVSRGSGCEGYPFILPGKVEKSFTVKAELQFGAKTFEYPVFKSAPAFPAGSSL